MNTNAHELFTYNCARDLRRMNRARPTVRAKAAVSPMLRPTPRDTAEEVPANKIHRGTQAFRRMHENSKPTPRDTAAGVPGENNT